VISGFRCEVGEFCTLLGYYTAYSGNSVPTFRDNLSVTSSRVKKSNMNSAWTLIQRLSRNVGTELPPTMRHIPEDSRSQHFSFSLHKIFHTKLVSWKKSAWKFVLHDLLTYFLLNLYSCLVFTLILWI